ncbi:hypothetical protein IPA_02835 [Ignicoccus pacificus DSM 13166]|uniref:Uncharacterized protein n=1 Tax=Ignicoccus pacificus DSM 13166 TaxID=940294 RepID=A0A977KAU0_9CREN|nr:hypothetical protein IPA_02835 [Ignicoccus pacificus DSM 13166]
MYTLGKERLLARERKVPEEKFGIVAGDAVVAACINKCEERFKICKEECRSYCAEKHSIIFFVDNTRYHACYNECTSNCTKEYQQCLAGCRKI